MHEKKKTIRVQLLLLQLQKEIFQTLGSIVLWWLRTGARQSGAVKPVPKLS